MAQYSDNPTRFDPYKSFKFRVKWDGRYVAGVSKVSGLKRSTETVEYGTGDASSTSPSTPGRTKSEAITLERGITHDVDFHGWASKVWDHRSSLAADSSLKDSRRDVILERYNEAGQLVVTHTIYRAWVSEYEALPDLDANGNAVVIETLRLENEGSRRNDNVADPDEPRTGKPRTPT